MTFSNGIEPRLECDLGRVALAADPTIGAEGAEWNAAVRSAVSSGACGIGTTGVPTLYERVSGAVLRLNVLIQFQSLPLRLPSLSRPKTDLRRFSENQVLPRVDVLRVRL